MRRTISSQSFHSDGLIESSATHGDFVVAVARTVGFIVFIAAVISILLVFMFTRGIISFLIDCIGITPLLLLLFVISMIALHFAKVSKEMFTSIVKQACH